MISTTRTQNKYDHLLREHVRSTGDINHAIRLGVPRSTARGWVKSAPAEVITLDVVDMDNLRLQEKVLRLQSRLDWVIAILRLFVVVLKTSNVSLSSVRFPEGTAKRMLLRTIERSSCVLSLKVALRVIGLSHSRYHAWKQEEECDVDMPDLVGTGSANPDFRFGRVNASTRPSPFVDSHKAVPGGSRGKDLSKPLSK